MVKVLTLLATILLLSLTAFSQVDSSASKHKQDSITLSYCQAQQIAVELVQCDSIAMELVSTQSILKTTKHIVDLKDKIIVEDSAKIEGLKQKASTQQVKADIYEDLLIDERNTTGKLQKKVKILTTTSVVLALFILLNTIKY